MSNAGRRGSVSRSTKETSLTVELNLDGKGELHVETGVGFLDHMITALGFHAGWDLTLTARGDLEVDDHHTVEDAALTLGAAIAQALGQRGGIRRFAHAYAPLDEALARAVIDLSGVTWVTLQTYGYQNTGSGGVSLGGSPQQFPTEPLPMRLRKPSGHFMWQRDPFTPATPNQGNPRAEKIGLDLVLPYWMGRHLGAF